MPESPFTAALRNEVDRFLVRCKVDDIYGDEYLGLALERTPEGTTTARLLRDEGVPLTSMYGILESLCGDRAIRAELGRLRVNGKTLSAEKYLAAWRAAPTVDLTQLPARAGVALEYRGEARLADVADATGHRSDDAVKSFAEYRALRPDTLTASADGDRVAVTLPIRTMADLALARTLHRFLVPWRSADEPPPEAQGSLVPVLLAATDIATMPAAPGAELSLFATEAQTAA